MQQQASTPVVDSAPSTPDSAAVEPVVMSGGDAPATWDELERLTVQSKKSEPKEVKEPKAAKPKEEKAEPKEGKKETKGVEKPETPVKLLKLKGGDGEFDVAVDAMVPVKIDGKTVDVPLQEALNRYSQQSHLDQLYKTYKTEKESFQKERTAISEALNKSYDYLVNQKDLRGFLDYLGEAMGVDSHALYQDAVGNLQKQLEEFQSLSPEERKLRELESENAHYRKRMEAQKTAQASAKSKAALESQVQKVMETHQVQTADLVEAFDELTKAGVDADQITPEALSDYFSQNKRIGFIRSKLGEINESLANDGEIVKGLIADANKLELTEAEIAEVIAQVYGETPEKKLAKKIATNQKANRQAGKNAVKNAGSDPLFFDDI